MQDVKNWALGSVGDQTAEEVICSVTQVRVQPSSLSLDAHVIYSLSLVPHPKKKNLSI